MEIFNYVVSPHLKKSGLTFVETKNFLTIIDARGNGTKKYRYYIKKDIFVNLDTGQKFNFGIFKLLCLIDRMEDIIIDEVDRMTAFREYIMPYLKDNGFVVSNYLDNYIISHIGGLIDPFVYYPTTGNAVGKSKTKLGILKIFFYGLQEKSLHSESL